MSSPQAAGVRVGWADLPAPVRAAVEDVLGSPVVATVSQPGGFSPGSADRVVTADGRRAFVKAVSGSTNSHAPVLHRREIGVTGALPPDAPVPRLLGSWDDGDWVVLVLSDVEGRHPRLPWRPDELEGVGAALEVLAEVPLTGGLELLPGTGAGFAEDFAGWRRLRDDPDPELDPWAARHLDRLVAAADQGEAALAGDQLVHGDVRADNLLVAPDGSVVVVDWPWATRGRPGSTGSRCSSTSASTTPAPRSRTCSAAGCPRWRPGTSTRCWPGSARTSPTSPDAPTRRGCRPYGRSSGRRARWCCAG